MLNKKFVYLGGTMANNTWRKKFILEVVGRGVPEGAMFNPVVEVWDVTAQRLEEEAKVKASYLMFYIANPKEEGNPLDAYSIFQATMALYDKPKRTVVVFDVEGMAGQPLLVMNQTANVLKARFPKATILSSPDMAKLRMTEQFGK